MSRKALFQKRPQKVERGGEAFYVRAFTVGELKQVESLHAAGKDDEAMAYTIRRCVVDAEGERVLGDEDAIDDIPIDTVREVADTVTRLSSAGKAESLAKN